MKSEELKVFLTINPAVREIVESRLSMDDYDSEDEYGSYIKQALKDSLDPKKWKRTTKFVVGNETADGLSDWLPPELNGCIARSFWLKGTDHVTILLVEKDNEIIHIEDLSD